MSKAGTAAHHLRVNGIMTSNLYSLLLSAADECPDKLFLAFNDERISYAGALDSSRKFSGLLRARGLAAGDRVLLNVGNVPEMVYAILGSLNIGAVPVLVNPAARRHELRFYIEKTRPGMVVTRSESMAHFRVDGNPLLDDNSFLFIDDAVPERNFARRVASSKGADECVTLDDDHPAFIIFTAAEDGFPGGAMITHRAMFETGNLSGEMRAHQGDTTLAVLPLFHAFGLITSVLLPLYNRSSVLLVERFTIRRVAELIMSGDVTVFCGVPAMYLTLSRVLERTAGLDRVRVWVSGGEAIQASLQDEMLSRFGAEVRQGYGLTEASPIVTWNSLGKENRHGSVGNAMPYNEVKLVRDGRDADEGEVYVRGVNVVPGYFSDDEKTRAAISGGWLKTGDLASRDGDGCYWIRGRKKDMVLKNGFNVYPREVERILSLHPGVERVEVSGNIGCEGSRDSLAAAVRQKNGAVLDEKMFRDWCADNISSYKIPDMIRFD